LATDHLNIRRTRKIYWLTVFRAHSAPTTESRIAFNASGPKLRAKVDPPDRPHLARDDAVLPVVGLCMLNLRGEQMLDREPCARGRSDADLGGRPPCDGAAECLVTRSLPLVADDLPRIRAHRDAPLGGHGEAGQVSMRSQIRWNRLRLGPAQDFGRSSRRSSLSHQLGFARMTSTMDR